MSLPSNARFPWMEEPEPDEDDGEGELAWCPTCDRERPWEGCPACGDDPGRPLDLFG